MSEERAELIKRVIFEIYKNGNLAVMDEVYDPQVIQHNPPFQTAKGLQSYKDYTRGVLQAWSDVEITLHELIFSGDRSFARFTFEATHSGETPASRIPATGKRVSYEGAIFDHWKGDKIVEEWLYADYVGALQQIGAIPAVSGASS